jgi:alpha-ketoglutarate-dependent taurine dioxygenase
LQYRPLLGSIELADVLAEYRTDFANKLLEHGALLFRGFRIHDSASLRAVVDALAGQPIDYVYRSTPRTSVGAGIYSATEYPADQSIPLHNENAYQRAWPQRLIFCCLVPASSGGDTPIAQMSAVTARIGHSLVEEFSERGVEYLRHYHPHMDLPWQTVFQTEDRAELGRFCAAHDIRHEWLKDDILRTAQVCQGTARHPLRNAHVFFNQAHLFHGSGLGPEVYSSLTRSFGPRLPRHARFGDGAEIGETALTVIRTAFEREALSFQWQAGDVLLLDNMQFAHGRSAYAGKRQVLAVLLDPTSAERMTAQPIQRLVPGEPAFQAGRGPA